MSYLVLVLLGLLFLGSGVAFIRWTDACLKKGVTRATVVLWVCWVLLWTVVALIGNPEQVFPWWRYLLWFALPILMLAVAYGLLWLIVEAPLWVVFRFSSYQPTVDWRWTCWTVAVVVTWVMCIALVVSKWDDIAW